MKTEPEPVPPTKTGWLSRPRRALAYLKANRKRLFWLWISYQAIKGAITLTLIWIPLFLIWTRGSGAS